MKFLFTKNFLHAMPLFYKRLVFVILFGGYYTFCIGQLSSKKEQISEAQSKNGSDFNRSNESSNKWNISLDNFWVNNDNIGFFEHGLFSDYSLSRTLDLKGLPFVINGNAIIQNSTFNPRLSGINIEFEYERFLSNIKERVLKKEALLLSGQYQNSAKDSNGFVLQSVTKIIDKYADQVMDSIISETKRCKSAEIDSLSNKLNNLGGHAESKDSLMLIIKHRKDETESSIAWISEQKKALHTYESPYQKITLIKDLHYLLKGKENNKVINSTNKGIDSIFQKTDNLIIEYEAALEKLQRSNKYYAEKKAEIENLMHEDQIINMARQNGSLSRLQKIMLQFSELQLGRFFANQSPYTLSGVPLNGVHIGWKHKKCNILYMAGKEGHSPVRNQVFAGNINRIGLNRKLTYVKASIGAQEKSNAEVYFSRIFAGTQPDSVFATDNGLKEKNILLGTSGTYYFLPGLYSKITLGASMTDITGESSDQQLLVENSGINLHHTVFESMCGVNSNNHRFEAGIIYIGSLYQTFGNPYLLNNRKDIKIKSIHYLYNKRLSINLEMRIGATASIEITPNRKRNLYSVDAAYKINKKGDRFWMKYQPSMFSQQIERRRIVYLYNTIFAGYQKSGHLGKNRWLANINFMNYRQESNISDTLAITGFYYSLGSINMQYSNWSTTVSTYQGYKHWNIREYQAMLIQNIALAKFKANFGVQLRKNLLDSKGYTGLQAGCSKRWTSGEIGLQGNYIFYSKGIGNTLSCFIRQQF